MADLIDRQALYEQTAEWEAAAMEAVKKVTDVEERKRWGYILQERAAFKQDVADAPSAQPEPRWIPVSESPEYPGRFLCYYETEESGEIGHCIDFGTYDEGDGWYVSGVKYWMPLPDEPHERSEDG